mgnify:CR=1 FL=1
MLNISKNSIISRVDENNFMTLKKVESKSSRKTFIRFLFIISINCVIISEYLIRIHETVRKRPNFVVDTLVTKEPSSN